MTDTVTKTRDSTEIRLAVKDMIRAAINLGRAQVYTDEKPERICWLRADERELERTTQAFWRAFNEEE